MVPTECDCSDGVKVERDFETSRMAEELLASAYEIVLPISKGLPASKSRSVHGRLSLRRQMGMQTRPAAGVHPW